MHGMRSLKAPRTILSGLAALAIACALGALALLAFPAHAEARPTAEDAVDVVGEPEAGALDLGDEALPQAGGIVVALDPGHGGGDSGAVNEAAGLKEKDLTWKISQATKEWLEARGVKVVLTHDGTERGSGGESTPTIYDRVQRAARAGACVVVSQHINSGGGTGFEVWIPRNCSFYNNLNTASQAFAQTLKPKLAALGLANRGTKTSRLETATYANGDVADYYGVIRYARREGTAGVVIEHAFIDRAEDAALLANDDFLRQLGIADAEAIYQNLSTFKSTYDYNQAHPWTEPDEFDDAAEGSVFRLFNKSTGEHLFTTDANEAKTLTSGMGWRSEGVEWLSASTGDEVYRLYNPANGEHLYTTDRNEYATLGAAGGAGWRQEGVAFHSAPEKGSLAVYRLFNPNATVGTHHMTTDGNEYETLGKAGWRGEGVVFYGLDPEGEPGSSEAPAVPSGTPIMGASATTREALSSRFASLMASYGKVYPSLYAEKGAPTAKAFAEVLWDQASSEGVRPEVLLAQVVKETGWLQFGGMVRADQCNFGGIGALDNSHGESVATFSSVAEGLLAQAQHLKAYASTEPLANPCVDPRFPLVSRGCSPTVEGLSGKWATDPGYGASIVDLMNRELL